MTPELSIVALARLRFALSKRIERCFLCRRILNDLEKNGELTGAPKTWDGDELFPVEGKMHHLKLEGLFPEGCGCEWCRQGVVA